MSVFTLRITELEQRLMYVLDDAFLDCSTVASAFKLVDSFGELLERDFIQSSLENKHLSLIRQYGDELREVTLRSTCSRAPRPRNLALPLGPTPGP